MGDSWLVDGAARDAQSVTKDWQTIGTECIDGVDVREVSSVLTGYGRLTEIHRAEWDERPVGQVFQSVLGVGAISAWHAHEHTLDRLFATAGSMLIVLFDGRPGSPTRGMVNRFRFGEHRPGVVSVPPRVWHGVKNIGDGPATLVNVVDAAYEYEEPDHYRVPLECPDIPVDLADER